MTDTALRLAAQALIAADDFTQGSMARRSMTDLMAASAKFRVALNDLRTALAAPQGTPEPRRTWDQVAAEEIQRAASEGRKEPSAAAYDAAADAYRKAWRDRPRAALDDDDALKEALRAAYAVDSVAPPPAPEPPLNLSGLFALKACEEVLRLIHGAAGTVPRDAPMPQYSTFEAWQMAAMALRSIEVVPAAPRPEEGA